MIYHIVAMANNRVIGKDNRLPWHFPEDLKHFKKVTTGSTVIMGRKTYESIGKPLPNRINFVLSRNPHPNPLPEGEGKNKEMSAGEMAIQHIPLSPLVGRGQGEGEVFFFPSIDKALANVKTGNAFIIGGADLFNQTLHRIEGIYLTRIDRDYAGDAFYPEIPDDFEEVEIEVLREKDPKIQMVYYEKVTGRE